MEPVSQVPLLMEFIPVELIKVSWQFSFSRPIQCLQLQFTLRQRPSMVLLCSSVRVNKIFRVIDHQVDVAYIVQGKVWREPVRNDHGTRFNKLALLSGNEGLSLVIWNAKKLAFSQYLALPFQTPTAPQKHVHGRTFTCC